MQGAVYTVKTKANQTEELKSTEMPAGLPWLHPPPGVHSTHLAAGAFAPKPEPKLSGFSRELSRWGTPVGGWPAVSVPFHPIRGQSSRGQECLVSQSALCAQVFPHASYVMLSRSRAPCGLHKPCSSSQARKNTKLTRSQTRNTTCTQAAVSSVTNIRHLRNMGRMFDTSCTVAHRR